MSSAGVSAPAYLVRHSGPILVCGNAFNLHEDLECAREIYPDAQIIAINGAAREVKAFALFSYHPQRFVEAPYGWINRQKKFHNDFTVHGSRFAEGMPYVDHWWSGARGHGGSAWGARKLGALMGFDQVILCGCPLVPGNYAGFRPGDLMSHQDVVDRYLGEIEADVKWHKGVVSMSGATQNLLGAP